MSEDIIQRAELAVTHLSGCVIHDSTCFRCDCAVGDAIRQLDDAGLLVDPGAYTRGFQDGRRAAEDYARRNPAPEWCDEPTCQHRTDITPDGTPECY